MNDSDKLMDIKILERTYKIKCPASESQKLQESAQYLDDQMRQMRQSGSANNTERLAIVTALNICHELMMLKNQKDSRIGQMNEQIKALQSRIQIFLGAKEEIAA